MKKQWGLLAAAFFGAFIVSTAMAVSNAAAEETAQQAAAPGRSDLVINVGGFAHERGQAVANLFREGEDVFHKPYRRVTAKIEVGKAVLVFPALQHGTYAITMFHDENGNNDLDHNIFHIPAEPLGFSNGFKFSLFSGLPNFEKLRFEFGPEGKALEITVK